MPEDQRDRDLGLMLLDIDYANNRASRFFHAALRHGGAAMTVLAALTAQYGRLERRHDVAPFGYSREAIAFGLVLSANGEPIACDDLRLGTRGEGRGQSLTVPRSVKRSGIRPPPFFLWDNSHYVLGLGHSAQCREPAAYAARADAFRA
ncbi:CRISPR-associated protein, Cas5d family [Azospirillum doebereinerae]